MSAYAGIAMLLVVAIAMVLTGLPTWLLLIGTALAFAIGGVLTGAVPAQLFGSVAPRLVGLLENDLLQALPLYVLMGALLNRLPLADVLFRAVMRVMPRRGAGAPLSAVLLASLFAPMNGSVGASVVMLGRSVAPRLADAVPPARMGAIVAASSTLGIVVPPSLVLILLGDAMLRAHTEAVNITGQAVQIVNTQDVFRGALIPAAIVLLLTLLLTWRASRERGRDKSPGVLPPLTASEAFTAMAVIACIVGLLGGVTLGYVYAVEAAAAGGVALFLYGILTRSITAVVLRSVLRDAINVTGALFALLVAATMFTLVVRGFGTDRLLAAWLTGMGGGSYAPLASGLIAIGLCAFVLDAFEMIFVVIPVLVPPMLVRVPDPVWVAVLVLLILQVSFILPPFGYAVLMVRNVLRLRVPMAALGRALRPYVLAQALVIAVVLAWPGVLWHPAASSRGPAGAPVTDDETRELMERQLAPPPDEPQR